MHDLTANSRVAAHLRTVWPKRRQRELVWTAGPIAQNLPSFRVLELEPSHRADPWLYASDGIRGVPTEDNIPLEFFIESPARDPIHVETLAMLANFHADDRYRLALGKVVNIGRPWIDGSICDHLLVSLPYPFGPAFEWFSADEGRVRLLWLLPITPAEARFARSHGYEALEERLDAARPDVLNVRRPSVIEQ